MRWPDFGPMPGSRRTPFEHSFYLIRRKVFTLLGAAFHVYGPDGQVILYSRQKAFKLREDIRLYDGEDMRRELLSIRARQIIDFSAAYDVFDTATGAQVGALRRRGLKSVVRDEWTILDPTDHQIGTICEDSMSLALLRRFFTNLVPQRYSVEVLGGAVAELRQRFNPFILKLELDFSGDPGGQLDRRLGIAAGVLLCAIEGRQG
jgi:uncharacterized protein YxjI